MRNLIALLFVFTLCGCYEHYRIEHRYLVDPGLLTYPDAVRGCRALNGYLIRIDSPAELEMAFDMAMPIATDHHGVFTGSGLVDDPVDYLVYMIGADSVVQGINPQDRGRTGHAFCEFDE